MQAPQFSSEKRKQVEHSLLNLVGIPFDAVPHRLKRRAYGVPYVQLDLPTGGTLWVTRHGWRHLEHLDPVQWYEDDQFYRRGHRLSEGSGAVYRVPSMVSANRSFDLIVKFSRMAQDIPVFTSSQFSIDAAEHLALEAKFNDPFQEFGLLEELRNSEFGSRRLRVRTKRPLAIYSPEKRLEPWQLGRTDQLFSRHSRQLAEDQAKEVDAGMTPVELSIDRQYAYLFHWVRGIDAQSLAKAQTMSEGEAKALVRQVVQDLKLKGFRVLDMKPSHIILRKRPDGRLLEREGRIAYVLVDFELLQRTEEYRRWRETRRVGTAWSPSSSSPHSRSKRRSRHLSADPY